MSFSITPPGKDETDAYKAAKKARRTRTPRKPSSSSSGRATKSDVKKIVECLTCFEQKLPDAMDKATLEAGKFYVTQLNRGTFRDTEAHVLGKLRKTAQGNVITISAHADYRQKIWNKQFGKRTITHKTKVPAGYVVIEIPPEEVDDVKEELKDARDRWIAGGKKGPNPFSKEAERKLTDEHKLIRWEKEQTVEDEEDIEPEQYINAVYWAKKPLIEDIYRKNIKSTFKKCFRRFKI